MKRYKKSVQIPMSLYTRLALHKNDEFGINATLTDFVCYILESYCDKILVNKNEYNKSRDRFAGEKKVGFPKLFPNKKRRGRNKSEKRRQRPSISL